MKALIVDDDSTLRLTVRAVLEDKGFQVVEAEDGQMAVDIVRRVPDIGIAILDVNMPRMSGLEALAKIKEINPSIFCIIATAYSNMNDAIKAIRAGAFDYLQKPVEPEHLLKLLANATDASNMVVEASLASPQLQFDEGRTMVGNSSSLQKVFDVIYRLAKVDTSVLIRGESGTGKELVARALHHNSHRKSGPFVAVNCAAIPETLIESELFGHEKGAFTGADKRKLGKFQQAEGGTIFLDEIGDISHATQVKLLRVLQERAVTMVGSNQESKIDVRIVAATHKPLEQMVEQGLFRQDLFFRLNVLPIVIPSLRDRKDDIPALTNYLVKKFNKLHKRKIEGVEHAAMNALVQYNWPGNIRELENTMERAFIMESSQNICLTSLPDHLSQIKVDLALPSNSQIQTERAGATRAPGELISDSDDLNFPALKERFEREFIVRALTHYRGKINQTAEATQMTKVTLLRKLEKFGIDPKEFYVMR
jgi:two-component system, NtrC family, response regulator HydG